MNLKHGFISCTRDYGIEPTRERDKEVCLKSKNKINIEDSLLEVSVKLSPNLPGEDLHTFAVNLYYKALDKSKFKNISFEQAFEIILSELESTVNSLNTYSPTVRRTKSRLLSKN